MFCTSMGMLQLGIDCLCKQYIIIYIAESSLQTLSANHSVCGYYQITYCSIWKVCDYSCMLALFPGSPPPPPPPHTHTQPRFQAFPLRARFNCAGVGKSKLGEGLSLVPRPFPYLTACARGKEGSGKMLGLRTGQGWNVRKGVRMQL